MTMTVRFASAAALAACTLAGLTAAPASAWPIPLTPAQNQYLNAVRGSFPGDDDQALMAGEYACHLLYTGQPASAAIDQVAAQYGASPDQAAGALHAARGALCPMAPG
jgi:hypothetical protein